MDGGVTLKKKNFVDFRASDDLIDIEEGHKSVIMKAFDDTGYFLSENEKMLFMPSPKQHLEPLAQRKYFSNLLHFKNLDGKI